MLGLSHFFVTQQMADEAINIAARKDKENAVKEKEVKKRKQASDELQKLLITASTVGSTVRTRKPVIHYEVLQSLHM